MKLTFAREQLADIWDEAQPLLVEHWAEIGYFDDIPLEPRLGLYLGAELAGKLYVFTARDGAVLVGYAAYMVDFALHYATMKQACQDVLFLLPAYRDVGNGHDLLAYTEGELRKAGVAAIYQHVKRAFDFSPLLERMGYEPVETIHVKRLDR